MIWSYTQIIQIVVLASAHGSFLISQFLNKKSRDNLFHNCWHGLLWFVHNKSGISGDVAPITTGHDNICEKYCVFSIT